MHGRVCVCLSDFHKGILKHLSLYMTYTYDNHALTLNTFHASLSVIVRHFLSWYGRNLNTNKGIVRCHLEIDTV